MGGTCRTGKKSNDQRPALVCPVVRHVVPNLSDPVLLFHVRIFSTCATNQQTLIHNETKRNDHPYPIRLLGSYERQLSILATLKVHVHLSPRLLPILLFVYHNLSCPARVDWPIASPVRGALSTTWAGPFAWAASAAPSGTVCGERDWLPSERDYKVPSVLFRPGRPSSVANSPSGVVSLPFPTAP
jgi:hypothetical protein